ncbi:hypothetical protein [Allokutzneria oryzae]|uniref:hypothetical protein n=1 Tax=Allokutzneria oryzae TaxID=1378989 RepID=UPI003671E434
MSSLFGEVWVYSLLAFLVGVGATWLWYVRPARRRLVELEDELARAKPTKAHAVPVQPTAIQPAPVLLDPARPEPPLPEPPVQELVDPVFAEPVPTQRTELVEPPEPVRPEPVRDETARIDLPTAKIDVRKPSTLSDIPIPPAPTEYLEQLQREREAEHARAASAADDHEPLFFEATTPPMGISQAAIEQELRAAGAAEDHTARPQPSPAPRSTQPTAPPEVDPMEMELADHTPTALIPRVEWRGGYPDAGKPTAETATDDDVDDPNAGAAPGQGADCEPERELPQRELAEPEIPQRQVAFSRGSATGQIPVVPAQSAEPEVERSEDAEERADAERQAEAERVAAEQRAEAERQAEAQRQAEAAEAERLEAERVAAEQRAEAERQAEAQRQAEARQRAEQERAEAAQREAELRKLQEKPAPAQQRTRSLFEPVVDPDSVAGSPNGRAHS